MIVRLKISRYLPGRIDPSRFEIFKVEMPGKATILDALEKIRLEQDPSLLYRRSCHHSACGTCALIVNGREALACITRLANLGTSEIKLEPLEGFRRMGDLVVDIAPLFKDFSEQWSLLRPIEKSSAPTDAGSRNELMRFEDCIECAACVSACPESGPANTFRGPAALAALEREMVKNPTDAPDLLKEAGGPDGAKGCRRALLCSRVCPTGVYPARSIYDLLKKLNR